MEGSIQTDQAFLEELHTLRARVAQLEQAEALRQQAETERHQIHMRELEERRELERHTQDALKALLAMAEVLVQGTDRAPTGELHTTTSVNRVIQRLLKLSRRVLGCKRMSIILIEPETELLQPVAVVGNSTEEMQQWQNRLEGSYLSAYFSDPQMLTDLYKGRSIKLDLPPQAPSLRRRYYQVMPMHLSTQLIGLLSLDYGNNIYQLSRDEMALAQAVSKLIALVIEREQLLQERAEARANELALFEANRRMDEFLSIASHELRSPLTTINGNIQLARRRLQSLLPTDAMSEDTTNKIDQIHDLLNRAEHQVRIQNRLVSDLLDVSRIQADRLDLAIAPCDLLAIVCTTVEDQRASTPARVINLKIPCEPVPLIDADSDRIAQVVTNYLTNALKYSSEDLPVEVAISIEDTQMRVSVRDEGPGLPLEEQAHLWERFYRVPGISIQSGSEVGLGLGLYICSIIIERHHGQVGVQSAPGQGSTFWFTLPITQTEQKN